MKDVVIGWIAPATCASHFVESLCECLVDDRVMSRVHSVISAMSGPLIAGGRTHNIVRFLETDAEWLLQIDSDMVFTPAQIVTLIESAERHVAPIVGALARGSGQRTVSPRIEAGLFAGPAGERLVDPSRARGLVPVDFVGACALIVHRSVFVDLARRRPPPQPWFQEVVSPDGRVDGEDWEFCRRATSAGYPVHVNADVRLGHVKSVVLRP